MPGAKLIDSRGAMTVERRDVILKPVEAEI